MNSNDNKFPNEMTISLREICWRLLEQWKAVLLVAFCVAVCFLGLMFLRHAKASNASSDTSDKQLTAQDIIDTLPENEQPIVAGTYRLLQRSEQLSEYITTAPIMQVDPAHAQRLRVSWTADTDQNDQEALTMAYASELQTEACADAIVKNCSKEIDLGQASEMIMITYPSDMGQGIICCDVYLTPDIDLDSLQVDLDQIIENTYSELINEFGPHQIVNYKKELSTVADDRILEKQTAAMKSFADTNSHINSLKNTFSEEQQAVYEQLANLDNEEEKESQPVVLTKSAIVRYALIGFVLGIIAYLVFFFLYLFWSGRIISADMLQDSSARKLGEWYSIPDGTKTGSFMRDRLIWKKHHRHHLDQEQEKKKTKDSITSFCKYKGLENLLLLVTGDLSNGQKAFVSDVEDKLKAESIRLNCCETASDQDNCIKDADLLDTDGVVLVIIDSKTQMSDLQNIFEKCNYYEIPIIGNVYIG